MLLLLPLFSPLIRLWLEKFFFGGGGAEEEERGPPPPPREVGTKTAFELMGIRGVGALGRMKVCVGMIRKKAKTTLHT